MFKMSFFFLAHPVFCQSIALSDHLISNYIIFHTQVTVIITLTVNTQGHGRPQEFFQGGPQKNL